MAGGHTEDEMMKDILKFLAGVLLALIGIAAFMGVSFALGYFGMALLWHFFGALESTAVYHL